jgi:hypothetical protein
MRSRISGSLMLLLRHDRLKVTECGLVPIILSRCPVLVKGTQTA